jgi:hypothetical protein
MLMELASPLAKRSINVSQATKIKIKSEIEE